MEIKNLFENLLVASGAGRVESEKVSSLVFDGIPAKIKIKYRKINEDSFEVFCDEFLLNHSSDQFERMIKFLNQIREYKLINILAKKHVGNNFGENSYLSINNYSTSERVFDKVIQMFKYAGVPLDEYLGYVLNEAFNDGEYSRPSQEFLTRIIEEEKARLVEYVQANVDDDTFKLYLFINETEAMQFLIGKIIEKGRFSYVKVLSSINVDPMPYIDGYMRSNTKHRTNLIKLLLILNKRDYLLSNVNVTREALGVQKIIFDGLNGSFFGDEITPADESEYVNFYGNVKQKFLTNIYKRLELDGVSYEKFRFIYFVFENLAVFKNFADIEKVERYLGETFDYVEEKLEAYLEKTRANEEKYALYLICYQNPKLMAKYFEQDLLPRIRDRQLSVFAGLDPDFALKWAVSHGIKSEEVLKAIEVGSNGEISREDALDAVMLANEKSKRKLRVYLRESLTRAFNESRFFSKKMFLQNIFNDKYYRQEASKVIFGVYTEGRLIGTFRIVTPKTIQIIAGANFSAVENAVIGIIDASEVDVNQYNGIIEDSFINQFNHETFSNAGDNAMRTVYNGFASMFISNKERLIKLLNKNGFKLEYKARQTLSHAYKHLDKFGAYAVIYFDDDGKFVKISEVRFYSESNVVAVLKSRYFNKSGSAQLGTLSSKLYSAILNNINQIILEAGN